MPNSKITNKRCENKNVYHVFFFLFMVDIIDVKKGMFKSMRVGVGEIKFIKFSMLFAQRIDALVVCNLSRFRFL